MRRCCFVLLILSIFGCSPNVLTGEGFSVLAEIRDAKGKQLNDCLIELQNQDGQILEGPINVPGKFHKVFIVAPNQADYLIEISCPGFKKYKMSVTYGENVTPYRPLRLGVIMMEIAQE